MNTRRYLPLWIGLLLAMLMIAGCGAADPVDTPTPEIVANVEDGVTEPIEKPTNTPLPPTQKPLPPTQTPIPPTDTPVPPTVTPNPTETSVPPTATHEPTPTWAGDLIGTWFKVGATINEQKLPDYYARYFADGILRVDESKVKLDSTDAVEVEANFWFEGDVLLVEGRHGRSSCPAGQIGRYKIELIPGESIYLVALDDPCQARVLHNEGTWTREEP